MLRHIAIMALLVATPSFAQETPRHTGRADRFVIANDECGASRYGHLIGQSYTIYRAALPENAIVHGAGAGGAVNVSHRLQQATLPMTLEFRPRQLNIVVDASAQIVSVGCY